MSYFYSMIIWDPHETKMMHLKGFNNDYFKNKNPWVQTTQKHADTTE